MVPFSVLALTIVLGRFAPATADRVSALIREYEWNQGLIGELAGEEYEVVYPFQVRDKTRVGIDTRNYYYTNGTFHYDSATFVVRTNAGRLKLHLRKNEELIPSGARFAEIPSAGTRRLRSSASGPENCFYQGQLHGEADSAIALSTCAGLRGVIFTANSTLLIIPLKGGDLGRRHPHILLPARWSRRQVCGNGEGTEWEADRAPRRREHRRHRRDVRTTQKFLELAVVADYAIAESWEFETWEVAHFVLEAANLADLIYQMNLKTRISVVYVEAWTGGNAGSTSSDSITATTLAFQQYAGRALAQERKDLALLLTGEKLARRESAMGTSGAVCSPKSTAVVAASSQYLAYETGILMVHSIAHVLGIRHDDEECSCGDRKGCLMSGVIGSRKAGLTPTFSACSRADFWETMDTGLGRCLFNRPLQADEMGGCGDGVRSGSEECDCGPVGQCSDPCCDPATCRLRSGAECAEGECCEGCRLRPKGRVCRASRAGEPCDSAERCDGESGSCPRDVARLTGSDCEMAGEAGRCWDGICRTPSRQCKELWGEESVVADGGCFEKFNILGSQYGHCGNSSRSTRRPCELVNVECGVLFCAGGLERPQLVGGKDAGGFPLTLRTDLGGGRECKALLDSNEGMAAEGAMCGAAGVCVKKACAPLSDLIPPPSCPSNNVALPCSGHGYCTGGGWCECRLGWGGVDCGDEVEVEAVADEAIVETAAVVTDDVDVVSLLIILGAIAGGLLLMLLCTLFCYRRRSTSAIQKKKLGRLTAELDRMSSSSLDAATQRSIKFGSMPSYRDEKRRGGRRVLHKIHEVSDERDSASNRSGLSSKSGVSSQLHVPAPPSVPSPKIPPERGILKRRDSADEREDVGCRRPLLLEGVVASSGDGGYESEPHNAYRVFERSLRKLEEYEAAAASAYAPHSARHHTPSEGGGSPQSEAWGGSSRRYATAALFSPPPGRSQRPIRVTHNGYATDTEVAYSFTPRSCRVSSSRLMVTPRKGADSDVDTSPTASVSSRGGLSRPQPIKLRNIELLLRQLETEDEEGPSSPRTLSEADRALLGRDSSEEVGSRTESQAAPSPPSQPSTFADPPDYRHLSTS